MLVGVWKMLVKKISLAQFYYCTEWGSEKDGQKYFFSGVLQ